MSSSTNRTPKQHTKTKYYLSSSSVIVPVLQVLIQILVSLLKCHPSDLWKMKIREQQQSTLPSRSSAISYLNIEPDRSGQDGVLMEDDDEVSKHTHSQAQMGYHMYWEVNRPSFTHVPVPAVSSSNQQVCYCILTFSSPLQQATALQFSLQITLLKFIKFQLCCSF